MPEHDPNLDELASAHLDGETDDDEAALVENDPSALARLDQFSALAGAIAQPVELPTVDQREDQIAAALAAALPESTTITSLAARRQRRAARQTRLIAVASVAAVVLLALVVVPLMLRAQDDSSELATEPETTAEPDEAIDQDALTGEGGVAPQEEPATESADMAPTTTVVPADGATPGFVYTGDLGDFATLDELVAEVEASDISYGDTDMVQGEAGVGAAPSDPLASCTSEDLAAFGVPGGTPTAVLATSVAGEPFTVVVYPSDESHQEMSAYVIDLTSCELVEVTTTG